MTPGRSRLDRRRAAGQATVELALLLPFVLVMSLVLLQIGLVGRDRLLLTHVTREAAREAAVSGDPVAAATAGRTATSLRGDRLRIVVTAPPGPDAIVTVVASYRATIVIPLVGYRREIDMSSTLAMYGEYP